jgi:F-type H+-transporting ATPase subunit delta
MKQSRTKFARVVADKTLKSGVNKRFSKEVAAYLLAERRVSELDSVLRDVQADWAEAGHVEVLAGSAHPLNAHIRAEIEREVKKLYPQAKTVSVREVADPEIIGGVRLSLANRQLDLSIEAKLNKFKQLTTAGKE